MRARVAALIAVGLTLWAGVARAQTVEARFDRRLVALGETATLRVIVRGASGAKEPQFDLPPELALAGSGRQQSFAWVNGRASVETEFRYEIETRGVGRFGVGPIVVAVGSQAFRSGQLELTVTDAQPLPQGSGPAPASLRVEVRPRQPFAGQEVTLIVRLVQRVSFAEDPQYTPPTTTGFWTDRPSAPESFYADERGERVLVTETRTRLFPLAIGEATVGEAAALVVPLAEGRDAFAWLSGRRQMILRSDPVQVRVLPLPGGAPAGFGGAVGRFEAAWSADRSRTSRDVPITLRLDVRGRGNLPLARPPEFADPDVELLAHTVDDSLPLPGSDGVGRKRYQWTVMPRHEGSLRVSAPPIAWFDPASATYRTASFSPVVVEVGPAVFAGAGPEAGFPRALSDRPVDPAERAATPWAFALAGLALAAARLTWSRRTAPRAEGGAAHAWRIRLKGAAGADVWRAAEESCSWLEGQLGPAPDPELAGLRERIAAARYGGARENPEAIRSALLARITRAAPARRGGGATWRALAILLVVGGLALAWFSGPRPGDGRAAAQCQAADQAARRGEVEKARAVWLELWRIHGGHSGLAARLGWASVQAGEIGPAALWVLRGELVEPRDPGLRWVEERVREAGGLVGATAPRWPVRRLEWAILCLALGLTAALAWPRRLLVAACAALILASAAIPSLQGWLAARSGRAVVLEGASLEGSDVELDPGQMVVVRGREGARVLVSAGRVVSGWVPATAVAHIVPVGGRDG